MITRGQNAHRPLRVLMHSQPKCGKSHLAAGAPAPFFLDFEEGTQFFDVHRLDVKDWPLALEAASFLLNEQHPYKTVVVDTLDAMERCLVERICHVEEKQSIGKVGGGFGKGWEIVEAELRKLLQRLELLMSRRGMNVVILAHSTKSTHSEPDGTSWSEYSLRCNKRTWGVLEGWVDEVLFMRRVVTTKSKKDKVGRGGRRVIETAYSPQWQAGSRRLSGQLQVPEGSPQAAWAVLRDAYAKAAKRAAPPPAPAPSPPQAQASSGSSGQTSQPAPAPTPEPVAAAAGQQPHTAVPYVEQDPGPTDRVESQDPTDLY